jgi:hypothetical protein
MRKLTFMISLLVLAVALPAVASARSDPGVIKTGKCSNGAGWKLKAKHDDGLIEVEFEVDQNISGRSWNLVLRRDGAVVARATRVTRPPSGSFELNRRIGNPAGSDRIVAFARAARGGTCRAALSI